MYGYADPRRHFAIAFVKNHLNQNAGWDTAAAVYASLERSLGRL